MSDVKASVEHHGRPNRAWIFGGKRSRPGPDWPGGVRPPAVSADGTIPTWRQTRVTRTSRGIWSGRGAAAVSSTRRSWSTTADQLQKAGLLFHHDGLVPVLEEVADALLVECIPSRVACSSKIGPREPGAASCFGTNVPYYELI
jgi:hypothetical protein